MKRRQSRRKSKYKIPGDRQEQISLLLYSLKTPRKRLSQSCIPVRTKDENISRTANARVTVQQQGANKVLTHQLLVILSGRNFGQSASPQQ